MKKISLKDKIVGIAFMILMAGCEKKIVSVADIKDDDSSTTEVIPAPVEDDSDLWLLVLLMSGSQY